MNAAKTKIVIIILLVAANLFFIYNIIKLNDDKSKISSKMIDDAAAILNGRGIKIDKTIIVREKPFYKVYEGDCSKRKDTESVYITNYKDIVKRITGADIPDIKEPLNIPNGTLYVAGNYKFGFLDYGESDTANMFAVYIIKDGYENPPALFDMDSLSVEINELLDLKEIPSGKNKKDTAEALNKFLGGNKNENNYRILYAEKQSSEDKICAVINQIYNNLPIASNYVYVEIYEKEVAYFGGNYYFHEFSEGYDVNLFDSANILLNISSKEDNILLNTELDKMELVYYPTSRDSENFYLMPMWRLTFADGSAHIFNSLTGEEAGI